MVKNFFSVIIHILCILEIKQVWRAVIPDFSCPSGLVEF